MKSEFFIKLPKVGIVDLIKFENEMDNIIANKVNKDFKDIDNMMIEIYSRNHTNDKNHPPLTSLGKMSVKMIREKFA